MGNNSGKIVNSYVTALKELSVAVKSEDPEKEKKVKKMRELKTLLLLEASKSVEDAKSLKALIITKVSGATKDKGIPPVVEDLLVKIDRVTFGKLSHVPSLDGLPPTPTEMIVV